jgi:hypothetical protein
MWSGIGLFALAMLIILLVGFDQQRRILYLLPLENQPLANQPLANSPRTNLPFANLSLANPPFANLPFVNPPFANPPFANLPLANPPLANPLLVNPLLVNSPLANPHSDLTLKSMIGMTYNPFTKTYKLESDVSVNYLCFYQK